MRWPIGLIAATLFSTTLCAATTVALTPDEQLANVSLAQRLAQMAQASLASHSMGPAALHQSIALLEAAERFDPTDPRYPRFRAEACLQLGGDEGRKSAIAALVTYLQLEPDDMGAQAQLIDLHFNQIDAADQRGKYIEQLINTPSLAAEVRSHVAVLGARLALDRAEDERARLLIEQALKLFPLSPEALALKYQKYAQAMPPEERVPLQLQMLRSNPSQPDVMMDLADTLSEVGLFNPALFWYADAVSLTQRMGAQPDPSDQTDFAAELVIADQLSTCQQLLKPLIDADAANSDAAFLSLLIEKRGKDSEKIQAASEAVRSALLTRLSRLSDRLRDQQTATTQASTNVNVISDVQKLSEVGDPNLSAAYAAGLTELAWLYIYFDGKPADADPYLTALRQLLSPDSATLARLDGWSYLVQGKKDEARVKLSAVAKTDPFAELGLLKLDAEQDPTDNMQPRVKQLLTNNASGLTGAVLIEALRDKVGLMPAAPQADAILSELDQFPKDWLDFTDFSKVKYLYALKGEPLQVAHSFGEPMLAKISITNTSQYDITIGPDGAIRPDIWVDVRVTGLSAQNLSGVAFDRITKKFVLHPKEAVSQIMRIDEDGLTDVLQGNVLIAMSINFSLLTNPMTQEAGVAPGSGGYRAMFTHVVQRTPSPFAGETLQKVFTRAQDGRSDVRMRSLDLLGGYVTWMRSLGDPAVKTQVSQVTDFIRKTAVDRVPAVRAHTLLIMASLSDSSVREEIIKQMLQDDSYCTRTIGLLTLDLLEPDRRKELAKPLAAGDSDPMVKKLAASIVEVADLPPATQPTSQPSDAKPDSKSSGPPGWPFLLVVPAPTSQPAL